jgi:hypothetical protein
MIDESSARLARICSHVRDDLVTKVRGKAIISIAPHFEYPKLHLSNWEVREIPFDKAPFSGEINIVGTAVAILSAHRMPQAILIQDTLVSESYRGLFMGLWNR